MLNDNNVRQQKKTKKSSLKIWRYKILFVSLQCQTKENGAMSEWLR